MLCSFFRASIKVWPVLYFTSFLNTFNHFSFQDLIEKKSCPMRAVLFSLFFFLLRCNYRFAHGKCIMCASQADWDWENMNYAKRSTCSSLVRSCICHFSAANWTAYTLAYKININGITQPVVIRNPSKNVNRRLLLLFAAVIVIVIVTCAYIFAAHVSFCLAAVLFTITQLHTVHSTRGDTVFRMANTLNWWISMGDSIRIKIGIAA